MRRRLFIAAALLAAFLGGAFLGFVCERLGDEASREPQTVAALSSSVVSEPSVQPAPTPQNLFAITPAPTAAQEFPIGDEASLVLAPLPSRPNPEAGATGGFEGDPAPTHDDASAFRIEVVQASASPPKRVLIYHTHTYEAYSKPPDARYQETEPWRTAESAYNVVRVGEELAGLLRGLGFLVEHDVTAFEPPDLSGAYARSLQMLERRVDAGERYDLYVDLHRDAYPASQTGVNVVHAGDTELSRLMLLVGKGEGQTSQGFSVKPNWEKNLAVAQAVTDALNAQVSGLCKNVMIKSGRYNQHVADGCVLIEAGNNQNTLTQTLAAMPYLADAIKTALQQ